MKKLTSIITLGFILSVGQAAVAGCGLGAAAEVIDFYSRIPSSFGKQYKDDAMVQAILDKDCAKVEALAIDPKKRLCAEVRREGNFKVAWECDYIGLTFAILLEYHPWFVRASEYKKLTKKDGEKIFKITQSLLRKGVSPESTWRFVFYERKGTKWVQEDAITLSTNKQFGESCEIEPYLKQIASLFK